ncbi:hypothetical protein P43SY_007982 [Pythium insidiosum]|uniref:Myb-like domain-containing protein n=1 Tax=Pythium insidiosum TaxID=114742 RepID=A0AAD5Q4X4_PYTIN|nr:hypothetical protein P43SY_007982 [Pythium insidiosum]
MTMATSSGMPSGFTTPLATKSAPLPAPQTSDFLPSISPGVVYSTAHAAWTMHETQLLRRGLADFPADRYDNVTRYIKIAATIPGKCVRDVAFKVKALAAESASASDREVFTKRMRVDHNSAELPSSSPLSDAQLAAILQDNALAINTMRTNLLNGRATENRDVMMRFRGNCQTFVTAYVGR